MLQSRAAAPPNLRREAAARDERCVRERRARAPRTRIACGCSCAARDPSSPRRRTKISSRRGVFEPGAASTSPGCSGARLDAFAPTKTAGRTRCTPRSARWSPRRTGTFTTGTQRAEGEGRERRRKRRGFPEPAGVRRSDEGNAAPAPRCRERPSVGAAAGPRSGRSGGGEERAAARLLCLWPTRLRDACAAATRRGALRGRVRAPRVLLVLARAARAGRERNALCPSCHKPVLKRQLQKMFFT